MTLSQAINTYDVSNEVSFDLGFSEDGLPDIKLPPENSAELTPTTTRFAAPVTDNVSLISYIFLFYHSYWISIAVNKIHA